MTSTITVKASFCLFIIHIENKFLVEPVTWLVAEKATVTFCAVNYVHFVRFICQSMFTIPTKMTCLFQSSVYFRVDHCKLHFKDQKLIGNFLPFRLLIVKAASLAGSSP